MPKEDRLSVRIPARYKGFKERLARCAKTSGIIESEIVISATLAAIKYIEKNGELPMPIIVRSQATEELLERLEKIWTRIINGKSHKP